MAPGTQVTVSYVLDWLVVVLIIVGGGLLTWANGYHRPFPLTDASLAYPYKADIITLPVVAVLSVVIPAAAIFLVNAGAALPHARVRSQRNRSLRAFGWSTHVGWLGLALSLGCTLFVTAGLKDMVGKPRPDLYQRCDPDLANLANYIVGGFGKTLDAEATPLVSSAICRQTNRSILNDGFASFPSGHSSISSSGMVYLTLWLCSRWNVWPQGIWPLLVSPRSQNADVHSPSARMRSIVAAPALWLYAIAFSPLVLMAFICASRYADFHHAGVDIFAGAAIGTLFSWLTFRLYHPPLGNAVVTRPWCARSADVAFFSRSTTSEAAKDEDRLNQVERGLNCDAPETC